MQGKCDIYADNVTRMLAVMRMKLLSRSSFNDNRVYHNKINIFAKTRFGGALV